MNISRKSRFTRPHAGQVIISGLAIVAVQGIVSLTGLGVPDRVAAQGVPTPKPITFGQNISGTLSSTDRITMDGRPTDEYRLVTQAPNQRYVITVRSPTIPIRSVISFTAVNLAGDPSIGLQAANAFLRGQQVQYSGRLPRPGEYFISVRSQETQRPVGAYTLTLTGGPAPAN